MNQGKRRIRYTVIALAGMTVLLVAAARLYASTVNASTPEWVRSAMTLGLAVSKRATIADELPGAKLPQAISLAELRDFTRVRVEGDFSVEVVGAPQYRVTLSGVSGEKWALDWGMENDAQVHIKGGAGTQGGVLRIETPVLARIDATGLRLLTVRGLAAPELTLEMKDLAGVRLEDNKVARWILISESPVEVQAEGLRNSTGLELQASGYMTINGPGAQKVVLRGGTSKVSIHSGK